MRVPPSGVDYAKKVQWPAAAFTVEKYRQAVFAAGMYGPPTPTAGQFAVVFKATVAGEARALRFFTAPVESSRERYTALDRHFRDHGLADLVALCEWHDDAITVKDETWPLVDLQWVEGSILDRYVALLVTSGWSTALRQLAEVFRTSVLRLQAAEFAHGDLQPGNIMIDERGWLRLVDFDGSWAPAIAGAPAPTERGQSDFQHPGRSWGRWMDTFPALVIHTSLLALAEDAGLWKEFNTSNNLIFSADDFTDPSRPIWRRLRGTGDPELARNVRVLQQWCALPTPPPVGLEELLGGVAQDVPATADAGPMGAGDARGPQLADVPAAGSAPWWARPQSAGVPSGATPAGTPLPPPGRKPDPVVTGGARTAVGPGSGPWAWGPHGAAPGGTPPHGPWGQHATSGPHGIPGPRIGTAPGGSGTAPRGPAGPGPGFGYGPGGPPPGGGATLVPATPDPRRRRRRNLGILGGVVALVVVVLVGVTLFPTLVGLGGVTRLSADDSAPSAFGSDFTRGAPDPDAVAAYDGPASATVVGDRAELYAGVQNTPSCERDGLAELVRGSANLPAWVGALRGDGSVRWPDGAEQSAAVTFVGSLTPAVLRADTLVTAQRFSGGTATAYPAVLERGTVVLLDARGVPRVRCSGAVPLTRPAGADVSQYARDGVKVVDPAVADVGELVLKGVGGGTVFRRPVGSTGEGDFVPGPDTASPSGRYQIASGTVLECVGLSPCDVNEPTGQIVVTCAGSCTVVAPYWKEARPVTRQGPKWTVSGPASEGYSFTCDGQTKPTTVTLELTVLSGTVESGIWVADRLRGTYRTEVPAVPCSAGKQVRAVDVTRG